MKVPWSYRLPGGTIGRTFASLWLSGAACVTQNSQRRLAWRRASLAYLGSSLYGTSTRDALQASKTSFWTFSASWNDSCPKNHRSAFYTPYFWSSGALATVCSFTPSHLKGKRLFLYFLTIRFDLLLSSSLSEKLCRTVLGALAIGSLFERPYFRRKQISSIFTWDNQIFCWFRLLAIAFGFAFKMVSEVDMISLNVHLARLLGIELTHFNEIENALFSALDFDIGVSE